MGYYETLNEMVDKSGFTLKEIAQKCEENGVKITPSYISKILTTRQSPASDEVNKALATVCNSDIDNFRYEAFMEKAPEFIKDLLGNVAHFFRDFLSKVTTDSYPEEIIPLLAEQQDGLSDYEIINHSLGSTSELFNFFIELKDNALFGDGVGLKYEEGDMSPIIPQGSNIHFSYISDIKSGDIVFAIEEDTGIHTIGRFIPIDDKVVIIKEDISLIPKTYKKEEIKIVAKIGKIVKYLE
ncbi:helix-turn-helix domain-containing protein [Paenibacillus piri]|uniref:Uncharacterized protein n=1 Tax=Paenibacillus piri TaxID=2547395 RepID=A0A4R5KLY1_9BACL|nr:helix-turn-helix transcriptional regulator [Paenibacillus piri]TDF96599.1 hypothetical protein E1757_16005 [Paenibacillus piri]